MITKEALVKGLMNYIDGEVLPNLSTSGKIISGTMIYLASPRLNSIVNDLTANKMVQALGIVADDGTIHVEALLDALKNNVSRFGKLELDIPLVGTLKFCADDIDRLGVYMR